MHEITRIVLGFYTLQHAAIGFGSVSVTPLEA